MGRPFQLHEGGILDAFDSVGKVWVAETEDEAIRRSAATLKRLKSRIAPSLFLHLPTVTEIASSAAQPQLAQVLGRSSGIDIRFLGESSSLKGNSEVEINSWFNLPYDSHLSTKGVEIYGRVFADLLVPELRALRSH